MEIWRGAGIFLSAEVVWGEGRMQNQRERRGQSGSLERGR